MNDTLGEWNHSEERCRTFHAATELSFFTMTISIILLISTLILNGLIIVVFFVRNKKLLHKSMYYKVLLNISLADFLTGLISDTNSISFHGKEALRIPITQIETILLHCSLFFINTASVLNIGIFCIDRVMLLIKPLKFRNGLKDWQAASILFAPWFAGAGLLVPYFFVGYIRYLKIFCFAAVTVTCICVLVLIVTYRIRLKFHLSFIDSHSLSKRELVHQKRSCTLESHSSLTSATDDIDTSTRTGAPNVSETNSVNWKTGDSDVRYKDTCDFVRVKKHGDQIDVMGYFTRTPIGSKKTCDNCINNKHIVERRNTDLNSVTEDEFRRSAVTEKRVNRTFITMLLVYLGAYLPSAIMTVYINTCRKCSCTLVHALRDLIFIFILSSAVWRPLNFILRLNTLRHEIKKFLRRVSCNCVTKYLFHSFSFAGKRRSIPAAFSTESFAKSCMDDNTL